MTERMHVTPGQTVGPFFGYALPYPGGGDLVPPTHPDAIRLHGRVLDGHGEPVPDALIEVWQPDEQGAVVRETGSMHRDDWTFTGWGRTPTDNTGRYVFSTVAPASTEPGQAPFFAVTVFARGLLNRLFTRAYLPSDVELLNADPLLSTLSAADRQTLVATADAEGFVFDIRLQGDRETVFLTFPGH